MPQQSSFAPQAASTRRSQQPSASYFGSGGQTPSYQQFGNTGNPSGIGAGSAGLNANDGPGGFLSGMSGSAQQYPGYTSNFQYGSMTAGDPSMYASGGYYDQMTAGANIQGSTGMPGGYAPNPSDVLNGGGMSGGGPASGGGANFTYGSNQPQSQTGGPGAAYIVQNGQVVQDPYAGTRDPQTILANNNYARQWNQGQGRRDAIQQMLQREQQQGAANQAGGAQSAMAGMQGGMNTQAIGQQMAAFGDTATYSPPTDFQSQPQSRYEQMAVDQSRYSGMPVSQLQNIANNDTTRTSLRAPIAEQSAILARMELANRGAGGNQVAVGNQQAADPFQPQAVDQIEPGDIMQQLMGGGGFWQGLPGQGSPFPDDGMINVNGVPYSVSNMGSGGIPGFEGLPTGVQIELSGQGGQGAVGGGFPQQPGPQAPTPQQPQFQPNPGASPIVGQQPQQPSNPYPGTIQTIPVGQSQPPIQVGPGQPQGIPLPGQQTPDDPATLGANRPFPSPTLPGMGNDIAQVPQGWDPRTGLPIGQNPPQPPPYLANQQQGDEQADNMSDAADYSSEVRSGNFPGSYRSWQAMGGSGDEAQQKQTRLINLLNMAVGRGDEALANHYRQQLGSIRNDPQQNLHSAIFSGQPSLN